MPELRKDYCAECPHYKSGTVRVRVRVTRTFAAMKVRPRKPRIEKDTEGTAPCFWFCGTSQTADVSFYVPTNKSQWNFSRWIPHKNLEIIGDGSKQKGEST